MKVTYKTLCGCEKNIMKIITKDKIITITEGQKAHRLTGEAVELRIFKTGKGNYIYMTDNGATYKEGNFLYSRIFPTDTKDTYSNGDCESPWTID